MSLILPLVFAQALSVSVGDAVALRTQVIDGEASFDAENVASAVLRLATPRLTLSAGYYPTVAVYDLGRDGGSEPSLVHTVSIAVTQRYPRTFVMLNQSASYGTQNLRLPPLIVSPLPEVPPAEPGTDPEEPAAEPAMPTPMPPMGVEAEDITPATERAVAYASTSTSFSWAKYLSRRLVFSEALGYSVNSGLDEPARRLYPTQHEITSRVSLGKLLTRTDTLTSALSSQRTFTGDASAWILAFSESWSKSFAPNASGGIEAGVAYSTSEDDESEFTSVLPLLSGFYQLEARHEQAQYELSAAAAVSPEVDRLRGTVDPRVRGSVSGSRQKNQLTLSAGALAISSLDPSGPERFFGVTTSVGATYALSQEFETGGSLGASWQDFRGAVSNTPVWYGGIFLAYQLTRGR